MDAPLVAQGVANGLKRVEGLKPGTGLLDFSAGLSTTSGAFATVEAGWQPRQNVSLFGFGKWTPTESSAGVGARLTF